MKIKTTRTVAVYSELAPARESAPFDRDRDRQGSGAAFQQQRDALTGGCGHGEALGGT